MKITEIKNLSKYLIGSIPIGVGTSAICFLMPNEKVLKIYYSSSLKNYITSNIEMFYKIGNETYIAPEELLLKDGLCIAQIYEYIPSTTLHNISCGYKMNDIISAYEKLIIDTKAISEKSFVLRDLHDKNILFNGKFNIIDLDRGRIDERGTYTNIFKYNMRTVNEVILYSLLKVKCYEILEFNDPILQESYRKTLSNVEEFPILLEKIDECSDTNIKRLSKKIEYKTYVDTFYRF